MTYNDIEFDDYSTSGGLWSHVCEKHAGQFDKPLLSSCAGTPICGVAGCNETAEYYIDFPEGGGLFVERKQTQPKQKKTQSPHGTSA